MKITFLTTFLACDRIWNKQSSSNYMINELCNILELMNFPFMLDTKYKFGKRIFNICKSANKLSFKNSSKLELCNVWEHAFWISDGYTSTTDKWNLDIGQCGKKNELNASHRNEAIWCRKDGWILHL